MVKALNLKEKQLENIKVLISNGYSLQDLPDDKGVLVYKNLQTNDTVKVKGKLKKCNFTEQKKQEAEESFLAYKLNVDNDSHLHCEVGKLVALTYAALYGREEMLIALRRTFSPKPQNLENT